MNIIANVKNIPSIEQKSNAFLVFHSSDSGGSYVLDQRVSFSYVFSKQATEKHSEVSVRSFAKSILSAHPCEKRVNHSIA